MFKVAVLFIAIPRLAVISSTNYDMSCFKFWESYIRCWIICNLIRNLCFVIRKLNCFLYSGKVREKFPLEMAEIQGAVVAADINDDGKIELVTTDTHGNVAAWTAQGVEIWESHLKSLVPQVSCS